MSGVWLRRREDEPIRHECRPPRIAETGQPAGDRGDIWRCECGWRWIVRIVPGDGYGWSRRILPWPRKCWDEKVEDGACV